MSQFEIRPSNDKDINRCLYCLNSLDNVSVKCEECIEYYLCLKCFSMSAEIGTHKKYHNYKINLKKSTNYPIFNNEKNLWTYEEELNLLACIEQHGFGNWEEIVKQMKASNKTADECMQHYYAYYVYGNIGKYTIKSSACSKFNIDHTKETDNLTILLPPVDMSIDEQRALGYMPLRDDFEREYKNDCECLISNLTIGNDDDETDIKMKLALMQMYRECLHERQRLKNLARQYGLINNASALINKQNEMCDEAPPLARTPGRKPKKCVSDSQSGEDKPLNNNNNERFKKFTQICAVSTYEKLMDNMRKRPLMLNRIQELMKYRELGLKKLSDIEKYEQEKHEREEKRRKATKRKSSSLSPTLKVTPTSTSSLNISDLCLNDGSNSNESSTSTLVSNNSIENSIIKPTGAKRKSLSNASTSSSSSLTSGRIERLCSMSGYNLLSDNEKKLITSLNMKPNLYITFKTFCIKNSHTHHSTKSNSGTSSSTSSGCVGPIRHKASNLTNNKLMNLCPNNYFQIPRSTKKRIIRFLCDNGWIDL